MPMPNFYPAAQMKHPSVFNRYLQGREMARREELAELEAMKFGEGVRRRGMLSDVMQRVNMGDQAAERELMAIDPQKAGQLYQARQREFELEQSRQQALEREKALAAADVINAPADQKEAVYARARQRVIDLDPSAVERLPENYNPSYEADLQSYVRRILPASELAPSVDKKSAKEQQISRLVEDLGVDRKTAVSIADGVLQVHSDPVTGNVHLVNKATGEAKPLLGGIDTRELVAPTEGPAPVQPEETLYDLAEIATGPQSFARETASDIGAFLPFDVPIAEKTIEARQTITTATNDLIRAFTLNSKYPVGEIKRLSEQINIEPSLWTEPKKMQARMRSIDRSLDRQLLNEIVAADNPQLPPEARKEAAIRAKAIREFLDILGVPEEETRKLPRVPKRAINYLRRNRKRAGIIEQFNQKYGEGAADRVLSE